MGIRPHLELIWGTPSSFVLLRLPLGPYRLVTVCLGILWCSIKEVKAPFMFDREQGIALHAMQEIGPHLTVRRNSLFFFFFFF